MRLLSGANGVGLDGRNPDDAELVCRCTEPELTYGRRENPLFSGDDGKALVVEISGEAEVFT